MNSTATPASMGLTLDVITLGTPEVEAARRFYSTTLSPTVADDDDSVNLDLHGTGRLTLSAAERLAAGAGAQPAAPGFRGYVLTYVVNQPTEVKTLMDAAVRGGAEVLKPAKKALFGSFSGVFRAPDGAIWKLAAATGKDTGPAAESPLPTETTLILGVSAPKASKAFYEALGMSVDRDYGSKYIDFHPAAGAARLCLMEGGVLARDAGTAKDGDGFPRWSSPTGPSPGKKSISSCRRPPLPEAGPPSPPRGLPRDIPVFFTDPDGFWWQVTH
ncbi:hypothetical protein ACFSTC_26660 [Nonomuraea ferruginea]